jgi:uncharacterized repeat protein (TIGR02543 family)
MCYNEKEIFNFQEAVMKKRIISLILTLALVVGLTPVTTLPASASNFNPITGWDMMAKLGVGYTFACTTEARWFPWHQIEYKPSNPLDYQTYWGQPIIEQWHFQSIAMKGFDSYRLCVSWTPHLDNDGKITPVWINRIQELADWALDAGLNVIINTHMEEELYYLIRDGKYTEARTHLNNLWSQIATRFKDYPETLIFEIMNEPNLKDFYDSNDGKWIHDENGQVDRVLRDTVNKLNTDALEVIRKSGGNNDKRVVMLCVPGADPVALPYMTVPENDPYIMLGTFGYDDFINDDTIPLIQAWLDKGIGFVNKEDVPGAIARAPITNLTEYTKSHFGRLAKMGIPSFWFGFSRPDDTEVLLYRQTGEWKNKALLDALFTAYGKTPGPDMPIPEPEFPFVIDRAIIPERPTWFDVIPSRHLVFAERMVVETSANLNWFQFETDSAVGWQGFQANSSRVTIEPGRIILDMRGLNITRLGFRSGGGDDGKITRVFLDEWRAPVTHTVTFNLNGGTRTGGGATSQNIAHGGTATAPTVTRTGHTFAGWDRALMNITGNVTVNALWTAQTFTITYNRNGGTNPANAPTRYTFGTSTTLPTPTRAGHTFAGWFNNASFTGSRITSTGTARAGNLTLFARWTINRYTVIFDVNGGSALSAANRTRTRDHNATVGTLPTPTRANHTFAGWFTTRTGGTRITTTQRITANTTYFARWIANPARPANPRATANSRTEITISWNRVTGATGYEVWRSTSANGTFTRVRDVQSGLTLSWRNTGLVADRQYFYRVRAYTTVNGVKAFSPYTATFNAKTRR